MNAATVDAKTAMDAADASELVQRKLAVDALKRRLGDGSTKEQKLREACEGFESIFLQKMWEQMRKNVKKEGYLHSKDEEAYQSMFDVELAKKMTSAGGIGLADMLQEQLSQRLSTASRSTTPGGLRAPLAIPAARAAGKDETAQKPGMTQDELYAPLPEENAENHAEPAVSAVDQALTELTKERGDVQPDPFFFPPPLTVAQAFAAPAVPAAPAAEQGQEDRRVFNVTPLPARVSAPGKARPISRKGASTRKTSNNRSQAARPDQAPGAIPGMAPGAAQPQGPYGGPQAVSPQVQSSYDAPQTQTRQAQGAYSGPQVLNSTGGIAGADAGTGAMPAQVGSGRTDTGPMHPGLMHPGQSQAVPAARLDRNV